MLPSQSWTDAITMPHNEKWVRLRDPGPKEGGARHYAARHYPYQHEEGRRHRLSPCQQTGHYYCHSVEEETPPQGPYMVGPPEPNTEASHKQMYFANVNEQAEPCKYYVILTSDCLCTKLFFYIYVCKSSHSNLLRKATYS